MQCQKALFILIPLVPLQVQARNSGRSWESQVPPLKARAATKINTNHTPLDKETPLGDNSQCRGLVLGSPRRSLRGQMDGPPEQSSQKGAPGEEQIVPIASSQLPPR